jgi:hypothetical protein
MPLEKIETAINMRASPTDGKSFESKDSQHLPSP